MILYRPVGLQELELIYDSGMTSFPARLPKQPIFYPVLQLEYARQIASGWNTKSGQSAGYVTQFKVEDSFIRRFEKHIVGKSQHEEYWIQAEEVEEFNRHITGHIKVLEAHFGDMFEGFVPEKFGLRGKNAVEQFTLLANSYLYKRMEFYLEIKRNHKAIFLNYPFWQAYEFKNPGLKEKIIKAIKDAWLTSFPQIPLPLPASTQENFLDTKQSLAPSLVEPAREDPHHMQHVGSDTLDILEEDTTLEEPVRSYAQSLVTSDDAHTSTEEETDSDAGDGEDLSDEDDTFVEDEDSDYLENSVPRHEKPLTENDSNMIAKPVQQNVPFTEQTKADSLVPPVSEEAMFVKETASPFLVKRVREEVSPPKQTASHLAQGIQLGLSGKYQEAVEELSKAVERNPGHVVARTSLGVAFHRAGEDERALACYDAALKIDPRYAEAHYFLANILYSRGNVREAIAAYTMAIGLKPELIEAHQKPVPQDRLTDYRPTPAEMHRIARSSRRILDLNKSLQANPHQANLFKQRAAEYERLENYQQAIADYNSALALEPRDAGTFHSRGVAYEQIGQQDRARDDYQKANALNPRLSEEYINRGVALGNMGNLRQSIASLTKAIQLAPQNPDGYFNRGTASFQDGDLTRAIEDFSIVIRLSAGDEAAYYWRGISNEKAGRREEAIADYRQFLELSQDPGAREEVEQRLSQWGEEPRQDMKRRDVRSEDRQETDDAELEKQPQKPDLYDLLIALENRALRSTWLGSGVNCHGEAAEELLSLTNQDRPIEGGDFVRIASGIQQTVQGDFIAFHPGSGSHWILIRAWNGNGFYIELDDPVSRRRLRARFPYLEEVEGATPPYEGLFIPI